MVIKKEGYLKMNSYTWHFLKGLLYLLLFIATMVFCFMTNNAVETLGITIFSFIILALIYNE